MEIVALLLATATALVPLRLAPSRSRSALITLSTATPDPTLNTILVNSADFNSQPLPLSYCERWPLWVADSTGVALTLLPGFDEESEEGGWCNPLTFEQLWLPQDLPAPVCTPALGVVLKDGAPSYVFPSFEATVSTTHAGGERVWHNRGLRSAPLAKTWLPWAEAAGDLCVSAYARDLPALDIDGRPTAEEEGEWAPLLPLTDAKPALETLSRVLAQAPPALGDGFAYLLVALPGAPPLDGVRAGRRIRVFLSDRERFPTSIDGDAQWHRGEADLRLYATSAGGESPYLPEVYKGLYLE